MVLLRVVFSCLPRLFKEREEEGKKKSVAAAIVFDIRVFFVVFPRLFRKERKRKERKSVRRFVINFWLKNASLDLDFLSLEKRKKERERERKRVETFPLRERETLKMIQMYKKCSLALYTKSCVSKTTALNKSVSRRKEKRRRRRRREEERDAASFLPRCLLLTKHTHTQKVGWMRTTTIRRRAILETSTSQLSSSRQRRPKKGVVVFKVVVVWLA